MNRIQAVQNYVNNIFQMITDKYNIRQEAYIHSYGVAQCCALIAQKRNLDVEIATVIGLLHDVYTYKTGVSLLHSHNGAEMVRVAFKYKLNNLFLEEEKTIIKSAIYHHSDKEHLHDVYDELIKDCDILQRYLYNVSANLYISKRLANVAAELDIVIEESTTTEANITKTFHQINVGDIAEELSRKEIIGTKENADYMEIIKYYPERSALAELDHAWCAAFVYHCCIKAGLTLPLRTPNNAINIANCRFACVLAWYEWADSKGYCFYEKDNFSPQRGDIVVYNNIIPRENKAENSIWCDHIGIVLSCDNNTLMVAEGNVGNLNVSGIVKRERNETIGCYIRIPAEYDYDDWQIDYKTGEERVESYV